MADLASRIHAAKDLEKLIEDAEWRGDVARLRDLEVAAASQGVTGLLHVGAQHALIQARAESETPTNERNMKRMLDEKKTSGEPGGRDAVVAHLKKVLAETSSTDVQKDGARRALEALGEKVEEDPKALAAFGQFVTSQHATITMLRKTFERNTPMATSDDLLNLPTDSASIQGLVDRYSQMVVDLDAILRSPMPEGSDKRAMQRRREYLAGYVQVLRGALRDALADEKAQREKNERDQRANDPAGPDPKAPFPRPFDKQATALAQRRSNPLESLYEPPARAVASQGRPGNLSPDQLADMSPDEARAELERRAAGAR